MNAIRVRQFGGPEVLEPSVVDTPHPGDDEVLVQILAAGVNPYDTYMRAGTYGARNPTLPFTPGSDAAGVVAAVGANVSYTRPGARVFTAGTITGAYAEYALCKVGQVHALPDGVSYAQGAGLHVPYGTSYRALFQIGRAKPGETVLVHGASGAVGMAALQLGAAAGLTLLATVGTVDGRARALQQGASSVFDHLSPTYREEILEATAGRGVDLILEMLGNVNLGYDLGLVAQGGRIVVIGSRGNAEFTPRDLMSREASIMGVLIWMTPARDAAAIWAALHAGLLSGELNPIVGAEMPLRAAAAAHRRIMEPGSVGKIVLRT